VRNHDHPRAAPLINHRFAFVEYTSKEAAEKALAQTDGYKLDKSHIFKVTRFDDFKKYDQVPDVYEPPKVEPFQPKVSLPTD
jgi:translation initiation factor 3 subunit B